MAAPGGDIPVNVDEFVNGWKANGTGADFNNLLIATFR